VTIFSNRNALVGFAVMKALQQRRKRKQRRPYRLAAYVALGVVSAGILAALLAVVLRRNGKALEELEASELGAELESELEAELDGALPDPADPQSFAE
jgi:H+/Cl- antiporter ClcA